MPYERLNELDLSRRFGEIPISVQVSESVDSTNNEAKRYAEKGGVAPCAFLAERQTAGRGRMGRSFYSPDGVGIYCSLLLPMEGKLSDIVLLTTASAVATRRAIRKVTGISVGIKWVNDLYLGARKVSGILAESFVLHERRYVVLGVGINLYTAEFPTELCEKAGSLLPDGNAAGMRNALAAELIAELYRTSRCLEPEHFMAEYRAASLVLGHHITYTENGISYTGTAESVDDRGRLYVRRSDGTAVYLASGEISLQIQQ